MPKITGGGIQSRIVKKVGVRTGPASSNKISPRGASQYGYATGSRLNKTGSFTTHNSALPVNAETMPKVPMGNAVALNVKGGGPGTGRTTYRSGYQGLHGPVAGPAPVQGREILGQFGPETINKSSLVRR